jgi:hypothetical protein
MVALADERETHALEQRGDRCGGYLDPEQSRDACGSHANGIAPRHFALHIPERSGASTADVDDELRRTLDGAPATAEIDTTLEPVSGVA